MANIVHGESNQAYFYKYSGFTSTIITSFSSPSNSLRDTSWDGSNFLSEDTTTDLIYKHSGFTTTISLSFSSPSDYPMSLAWDGENIISGDYNAGKLYKHTGYTTTVTDSFSSPSTIQRGSGWNGLQLIHADSASLKIYKYSGFSTTLLTSFSSPDGAPRGVGWWKPNALLSSNYGSPATANSKIYKHSGFTSTLSDSFSTYWDGAFGTDDDTWTGIISPTTKTVTSKTRIKKTILKTITASGFIFLFNDKLIQVKANIKNFISQTIDAKSSIKNYFEKTIDTKARIQKFPYKYITSKASIFNTVTQTIGGITIYDNGYTYRKTITIDHTKVGNSETLTDYPLLLSKTENALKTVANDGKVTDSNGYDITFYSDAEGHNQLDHEVKYYNAETGQIIFWVKIPTLSHETDTTIYIFYGNSNVTTSQENIPDVWDNGFKYSLHMDDLTTSQIQDVSTNENLGLKAGANNPIEATGKIYKTQVFNGTTSHVYFQKQWTPAHDDIHDLCYGGGCVWSVTRDDDDIGSGGYITKITKGGVMTEKHLSAGDDRLMACVYDFGYVWAAGLMDPGRIIKLNPSTLDYNSYELDEGENGLTCICSDGERYLYAGTNTSPAQIIKFDTTDNSHETITLNEGESYLYWNYFDGHYVWFVGSVGNAESTDGVLIRYNPENNQWQSWVTGKDNSLYRAHHIAYDGENPWVVFHTTPGKYIKFDQYYETYDQFSITGSIDLYLSEYYYDKLWVTTFANETIDYLYKIDPTTGEYTQVTDIMDNAHGSCFDSGGSLWLANYTDGSGVSLQKIDLFEDEMFFGFWINTEQETEAWLISNQDINYSEDFWAIILNANGTLTFRLRDESASTNYDVTSSVSVNDGEDHKILISRNSTTDRKIYIDGEQVGTSSSDTSAVNVNKIRRVSIGRRYDSGGSNDKYFSGKLEKVDIGNTNRTLGWAITEYNNQNSPSTFSSFSETEDQNTLSILARISKINTKTTTSKAYIKSLESKIITAKASIFDEFTKTIESKANIVFENLKTITSKANIKATQIIGHVYNNISTTDPGYGVFLGIYDEEITARDAMSFIAKSNKISDIIFIAYKYYSGPYNDITIEIQTDNSGYPSESVLGTVTITASTIQVNVETRASFASPISLTKGQKYWVVFKSDTSASWLLTTYEFGTEGHKFAQKQDSTWYIGNQDNYTIKTMFWFQPLEAKARIFGTNVKQVTASGYIQRPKTIRRKINETANDAFDYSLGIATVDSANTRQGHRDGESYGDCTAGYRFTNIIIDETREIVDVRFYGRAYYLEEYTVNTKIKGVDVDNSTAFDTDTEKPSSKSPLTTAEIDWDIPPSDAGENYIQKSPNISNIIKEIVSREEWSNGNSITLIIQNNGSTGDNNRNYKTYNTLLPKECSELEILYGDTNTKTTETKASIFKISNKTITSKGYILKEGNKLIQAKANIKNTLTQTIEAKTDIKILNNIKTIETVARINVINIKNINGAGNIKNTINFSVETKSRIKTLNNQTISSKSNIKITKNKTIEALSRISINNTEAIIQSKANIVNIGKTFLYKPDNQSSGLATVIFQWYLPASKYDKTIHSHIQIDDTSDSFESLEHEQMSWQDNSNMEYYDGEDWVEYPTSGVPKEYEGNLARLSITLIGGQKYWRVRKGIK